MKEIWKDIKGYEGLYQVSNIGRVKSLNYNHTNQEKTLKYGINTSGYRVVNLYKNGKANMRTIHRLVAETFISNTNNYPCINHKDENPSNNNVDNLEWCTRKYNNNYGTRNKKLSKTMKENMIGYNNAKKRKVKCITTGEIFISLTEAARKYNTCTSSIAKACKGEFKYTGKHPKTGELLKWKYEE